MYTQIKNRVTKGKILVLAFLVATLLATLLATASANAATPTGLERKGQPNVVQCPTGGSAFLCVGTSAGDILAGRDGEYDQMQGGEGNDTYDGKGGCDAIEDSSPTSSDRYLVSVRDFCDVGISWLSIRDDGGRKDVLDLSGVYESSEFVFSRGYTNLYLDGPGLNDISIEGYFTTGQDTRDSIETFRFSDKTLTARQVREMVP